jgi:hypothetical protein
MNITNKITVRRELELVPTDYLPAMDLEAPDRRAIDGGGRPDLKQQLNLAMATIMKLRGTTEQITETEIRDEIEKLQRAIQNWIRVIDKSLKDGHKDYKRMFFKTFNQPDENDKKLLSALKMMGMIDDSDSDRSRMWMLWLARLNTCIHVVFCRGIWACLEECVFSRKYPVGVDPETEDTFANIVNAMKGKDGDEGRSKLTGKLNMPSLTNSQTKLHGPTDGDQTPYVHSSEQTNSENTRKKPRLESSTN